MSLARIAGLICGILVLASGAAADTDIPGWGKVTWGMTHSSVKKHSDLKPWKPGSTPTCKSKQKVRIWGRDFTVDKSEVLTRKIQVSTFPPNNR